MVVGKPGSVMMGNIRELRRTPVIGLIAIAAQRSGIAGKRGILWRNRQSQESCIASIEGLRWLPVHTRWIEERVRVSERSESGCLGAFDVGSGGKTFVRVDVGNACV